MERNTKYLGIIVFICGISVSASAAFYSVFGLGKLFGGASTQIMIMASTLEISKLVIAAALHRHWESIRVLLKVYLISATIILVGITSAGIYGFLSSAYQQTKAYDDEIQSNIEIAKSELTIFNNDLTIKQSEKDKTVDQINILRESLGKNVQQTVDRRTGQLIITTSNQNRKSYESQIQYAMQSNKNLEDEIKSLRDSIISKKGVIVKLEASSSKNSELGPLKYISSLTNTKMDVVVNYFILVLIAVFDPLAVVLLILSQHIFSMGIPPSLQKLNRLRGRSGAQNREENDPEFHGPSPEIKDVLTKTSSDNYIKKLINNFAIKRSIKAGPEIFYNENLNNFEDKNVFSPVGIQEGENVHSTKYSITDNSTSTDSTIVPSTNSIIVQYTDSTEMEENKNEKKSESILPDTGSNSDIIISGNALPKTLSDKLKAFLSGEKSRRELSPSQKRIFTDNEIKQYYNKEK